MRPRVLGSGRLESLRLNALADASGGALIDAVELDGQLSVLSKEGAMSSVQPLFDAAGRRRSPATMAGFHAGRPPRNKGQRYPADPPTVDEIVAVMRHARHATRGDRLNGLIVVLWRAGLRINEALALTETDLDQRRGSILVRHGKNDRRREVGMDAWAWSALQPWLAERANLPVGPLFCVIVGSTRGHAWSASAARLEIHRVAIDAGVRRRFAPHQLRHAHAVELLHEGIPLPLIQRQLGHAYLSTTGAYLQGISSEEIISTVHARRAPMMHASAGLTL
jgi:site-specific recombinase XerD